MNWTEEPRNREFLYSPELVTNIIQKNLRKYKNTTKYMFYLEII